MLYGDIWIIETQVRESQLYGKNEYNAELEEVQNHKLRFIESE